MAIRACSGSACRTGLFGLRTSGQQAETSADLEVEGQQLGAVDHLADVLVGLVEGQALVPKQAVGRNQLRRLVLLPVQTTVEFGEEEVDLVRRLLLDGVELEDLQGQKQPLP